MPTPLRYRNPELCDALAARYVAGSMTALSRRRFERLCTIEPELAEAMHYWNECLLPLQEQLPAHQPPPRHWQSIASRIGIAAPNLPFWQRLWPWRLATLTATFSTVVLAVWALMLPAPEHHPDYLAPMSMAGGETALVISGYQGETPGTSRLAAQWTESGLQGAPSHLTLWAKSNGGAPVKLGEIQRGKSEWQVSPERWQALIHSERLLASRTPSPPAPDASLYSGPCLRLSYD